MMLDNTKALVSSLKYLDDDQMGRNGVRTFMIETVGSSLWFFLVQTTENESGNESNCRCSINMDVMLLKLGPQLQRNTSIHHKGLLNV